MTPREFEVVWDAKASGKRAAAKGVPQSSPLWPVLFLIYMDQILEEMKWRDKEEVGRETVCFPSYVDDLHCRLYDNRRVNEEVVRRERMQDVVVRT